MNNENNNNNINNNINNNQGIPGFNNQNINLTNQLPKQLNSNENSSLSNPIPGYHSNTTVNNSQGGSPWNPNFNATMNSTSNQLSQTQFSNGTINSMPNQSFQTPSQNVSMNNASNQQPHTQFIGQSMGNTPQQPQTPNQNYQQPMYQNYNLNNSGQAVNNGGKNNNMKLFIIIGSIVLVIAIVVILIIIFSKNSSSKTENEYEENNTTNNDINQTSNNKIDFMGFEFEKISGYNYSPDDDILIIENTDYHFDFQVLKQDFEVLKNKYLEFTPEFENVGFTVNNASVETISNKNLVLYEITYNSTNGYLYVIPSDNNNYIFFGSAVNRDHDYNKSTIQELVKVSNSSKYIGNYSDYSSAFDMGKIGF